LVQSSLFGEGGNIYNMQAGGPRPGKGGRVCGGVVLCVGSARFVVLCVALRRV
jgi:hypothetical protein